jgi:hypothetical protein
MTYIEFLAYIASGDYRVCGLLWQETREYFLEHSDKYLIQAKSKDAQSMLREMEFTNAETYERAHQVVLRLESEI